MIFKIQIKNFIITTFERLIGFINKFKKKKTTNNSFLLFESVVDTTSSSNEFSQPLTAENILDITHKKFNQSNKEYIPYIMLDKYRVYLKSEDWKILRKQVFRRDSYRCVRCGYIGDKK